LFEALTVYHLIIIFSVTIIISYFFNLYAKKSGVPSVLLLIGLGIVINYSLRLSGFQKPDLLPILEVLGVVGLILIVLEAALDLHLLKEKIGLIVRSFLVALIGLGGTAYLAAFALNYLMGIELLTAMLYTIPLSILSSAIILPSIDDLDEDKREFMIYESTFSDIVGIIGFYSVLTMVGSQTTESVYGEVFGNLVITIIFSIIISYILIYVFQNIKGHVKLFLLIAILLLLYAVGKMFHLSSLIIILIFGVILNNYKVFFRGGLMKLLNEERVGEVLDDMKVVTAETAFVVRTFFFIIFGWSVFLGSLLSFKVMGIGLLILGIIYFVRVIVLFIFNGRDIIPQLFLAPRGLITILLFFAIPEELSAGKEFQGVLLFVILISCFIMTRSLISYKNKLAQTESSEENQLLNNDFDITPAEENIEEK
jgi:NhaP-type Na+/H+ and K+/H+ antiporter